MLQWSFVRTLCLQKIVAFCNLLHFAVSLLIRDRREREGEDNHELMSNPILIFSILAAPPSPVKIARVFNFPAAPVLAIHFLYKQSQQQLTQSHTAQAPKFSHDLHSKELLTHSLNIWLRIWALPHAYSDPHHQNFPISRPCLDMAASHKKWWIGR